MESDVTEINVTTVLILSTYESNRRGYLRILYSAELYSYSSPPSFWLAYSKNAFCFFVINDVIATIRRTEINCECVRTPTIIHRWIYLSCPRRRKSNQRRRIFALTSTEAAFPCKTGLGGAAACSKQAQGVSISGRTFSASHLCLIYNRTSAHHASPSHTISQSKTIQRQQ
jgi:hypothetical protein